MRVIYYTYNNLIQNIKNDDYNNIIYKNNHFTNNLFINKLKDVLNN